jgi:glycosyltransferase involved in cell wall biosynthesis
MPPIGYDFDVVWYTTLGLAAQAQAIEAWLPEGRRRLRVAAVSDCYTAMLRANGRDWFGPRWTLTERAIRLASWSRSWYSAKWERRALQHIDIVLVQTPTDAHWMRSFRMVGPRTRLVICPNGVETELFQIPIDQKADAISFVAPFSVPEEARAARHLLTDIWPFIRERLPNAKLRIVGPDLPEALVRKLKHDARVTYATHHPEVRDLYSDAAVMLNFNIKRLGLINRVVEAMAAGVVVVGQSGSFNGIDGFTHGIHGLVAETVSEMRTQLLHILPCTTARIRMAHSARKLASANFRWEQRVPLLLDVLHETRRR